jgi:hypothetical protein
MVLCSSIVRLATQAPKPDFHSAKLAKPFQTRQTSQTSHPKWIPMDFYGFLWIPMDSYSTPKIWLGPHSNVHGGPWTTVVFEFVTVLGDIYMPTRNQRHHPQPWHTKLRNLGCRSHHPCAYCEALFYLTCSAHWISWQWRPALFCTWTNGVRAAWCQSRHVNRVWATRFMRSSGLGHWWQVYLWQNKVLYVSRHQPLEFDFAVRSHAQELSLYVE